MTTQPATFTSEITTTDANGVAITVTQIIHNPTGGLNDGSSGSNSSSGSSFFNNTGAVVGVFVVVGIAGAAILLGVAFLLFRRRRRQRLDRDVAAAAAAAAAAASRTPFDDDEDNSGHTSYTSTGPAMTQYGGYYAASGPPGQALGGYDYEDPAGGYDQYAAAPPPGAAGGYDRSSVGTTPGMAGFGGGDHFAQQVQAQAPAQHDPYYFDPNDAQYVDEPGYADDVYGGYAAQSHHGQHEPAGMTHGNSSEGSVIGKDERRGGLKVCTETRRGTRPC